MATPLPIANGVGCGGATVGTSAVQLTVAANTGSAGARTYHRIINNGPGTLWVTRDPNTTPAPNVPGAWAIYAGSGFAEEYNGANGSYVPSVATYGSADTSCFVAVETR